MIDCPQLFDKLLQSSDFFDFDIFLFALLITRVSLWGTIKTKSEHWNSLSYRGLPYFFEVGSQTFRNDYEILRSQPQNSTSIVLWPQWPQKRHAQIFWKWPQSNANFPKINGMYESYVEVSLKPNVTSSEGCILSEDVQLTQDAFMNEIIL